MGGVFLEEKKNVRHRSQSVLLENREKMSVSGVEHVSSFNETAIELVSVQGNMIIKGEGLDIKKLNLDDGNISIEGFITSITYTEKEDITAKGKGFLGKMFK